MKNQAFEDDLHADMRTGCDSDRIMRGCRYLSAHMFSGQGISPATKREGKAGIQLSGRLLGEDGLEYGLLATWQIGLLRVCGLNCELTVVISDIALEEGIGRFNCRDALSLHILVTDIIKVPFFDGEISPSKAA